jgi:GntR family transcriptional regulator / MocR family aminotransferase
MRRHRLPGSGRRPADPLAGLQVTPTAGVSLQSQIRQRLIEHILAGQFLPGQRLGVARNTALLAYQALIEAGHVIAKPRSGLYLNESLRKSAHAEVRVGGPARSAARTAEGADRQRRRRTIPAADWLKPELIQKTKSTVALNRLTVPPG